MKSIIYLPNIVKVLALFFVFSTIYGQTPNFQETKGELNITDSGVATYSVPIALPPSINKSAPVINLIYASGVRGGIAGQGWNISSISSITRMATRRDIEGFLDGVDFDDNDKLALDGQRLLLKSGVYWQNNSTYETEYKSNIKIELKIEGIHTYFIVTTPDGSRTWYGSTGNGVIQNATSLNAWYIIRNEDVYGNYITYVYNTVTYNNTPQLYIDSILFSGNEGQGIIQANKIKFNYVNSARVERDFIKGAQSYASKILDNIEVSTNSVLFRKYQLTRFTPDESGYQRVQSIQEFNGLNEPSNPVTFEYYSTTLSTTRTQKTYVNNLAFEQVDLAGDFDGDGRLDFGTRDNLYTGLFDYATTQDPIVMPSTVKLLGSTYASSQYFPNGRVVIPPGKFIAGMKLTNNIIKQKQSIISFKTNANDITVYLHNLNELNQIVLEETRTLPLNNSIQYNPSQNQLFPNITFGNNLIAYYLINKDNKYYEGDFNGDGISELLIIKRKNPKFYIENDYSQGGSGDTMVFNQVITDDGKQMFYHDLSQNNSTVIELPYIENEDDKLDIADFNGDGKSDIIIIGANQSYKIYTLKKLSTAPWIELEIIGQGIIDSYSIAKQILYGDFNGDTKTDIMLPDSTGGSGQTFWHIYYSNPNPQGGSFFIKESHDIVEYWPDTGSYYDVQRHWSTYYAMDVNKDGKSDLVRVWRKYYKPAWTINDHDTYWSVSAYTNNIGVVGANGFLNTYFSGEFWSSSPDIPIPVASNFKYNNANTDLILIRGHYNKIEYYQFNKNFDSDNRLKSVTESNGNVKNTIEYMPMMAQGGGLGNAQTDFYSSSESESYPNIEIIKNENNFLVSKLTATVNGSSKFQDFRYRGFVSNFIYGTIGFKRTTRSGWYLASTPTNEKIWSTTNNDVSLRGANTITWSSTNGNTVFDTTPTNLISTKINNFSTYTFEPSKVYNVLLDSQIEINALTGVKVENLYTYDGTVDVFGTYGLQTSLTTNRYNGSVLQGTTTVSTPIVDYDNNPGGLGNAYYIGKPKKIATTTTIYPNTADADTRTSEEKYTYLGANISKIEKKGHNTDYLVTDMTYDGLGNLLTKTVSMPTAVPAIAPRTITDVYDSTKRFVVTKTDHQGFVTQLEYNSIGQLKKSTNYLGVINEITYDNWGKVTQSKTSNTSTTALISTTTYAKLANGGYTVTVSNTTGDNAMNRTEFDVLGRTVKQTTKGFASGSEISTSIEYDALGRKYRESEPYFTSPSKWTTYQYDYLSRPTQITQSTTRLQTITYDGLTAITVDDGNTSSATVDALGNKISTTDSGGTINFYYYANGQLRKTNYDGHEITISIDGWGNKIATNDPNAGTYSYTYDAFGQQKTETTPKGTTTFNYDGVGKLTSKVVVGDGTDLNTTYTYNSFAQLLTETTVTSANVPVDNYTYTYDALKRLTTTLENNATFEHTKTIAFDTYGRPETETNYTREKSTSNFSSTVIHKFVYSTYNGIMYKITDNSNVMLWQLNTANEKMQTLTASLGNGIAITNSYNADYYFASQQHKKGTVFVVNNSYDFNSVKGNLMSRQNLAPGMGITENFTYDNLDRLLSWSNPATGVVDSNVYDNRGRITTNNKLGSVSYNTNLATGIYKKDKIALNTEGYSYYAVVANQQVNYTMFKAPIQITDGASGKCNFQYNSHLSRTKMLYDNRAIAPSTLKIQQKTKLYTDDGASEVIYDNATNTIKIITFVGGDAYGAPLYNEKILNKNTNVTSEAKYYLHRDYLGSIIAISNTSGVAIEKRHFDAWGNLSKIVNSSNVALPIANGLIALDRGYTSHEHLREVNLINMNGRLYDPALRSFLMPDNFVQQPTNTQNYNRYSYVLNNPLRYTDSTGESAIGLGVAVIIAVAVAVTSYTLNALLRDVPFTATGVITTSVMAAVTAVATYGIGSAANSLFGTATTFSKAAFQAVAHGFIQGAMSGIQGGKFWSGFAAGAVSSIASSGWSVDTNGASAGLGLAGGIRESNLGMVAFGTVTGGASAKLAGGNFWEGAVTGLFVSGLNHVAHRAEDAFARHKFDKEIDAAYGSKADSAAPATDATLTNMVDDVPTLKSWYGKSGKPGLWAQSKYTYAPSDGISEAKTFAYDTDNYKSSSITFFKSSFASYRTLAYNMLHEFGHAYYNYTGQLASMIGKYGQYSNKPQAFSEVYAFKFAFQYGGVSYSNNAWYQINLARTK